MLVGRPSAPDAAITALSLCFQNDLWSRRYEVSRSYICRGLRNPAIHGALPSKPLGGLTQIQLPNAGLTIRKNDKLLQKDWTDGSTGSVHTQASPREPSANVSVKRPLQRPLEHAITVGNWGEAVVLIERLLLVGALPENLISDQLLKGGRCLPGGHKLHCHSSNWWSPSKSFCLTSNALCRPVCKGSVSHSMEAVQFPAGAVEVVPVFNLPGSDHGCFSGECKLFLIFICFAVVSVSYVKCLCKVVLIASGYPLCLLCNPPILKR